MFNSSLPHSKTPGTEKIAKIITREHTRGFYKSFLKSFLDRLLALIAIILLSPFFIVVALVIRVDTKGPVLFIQERLGQYGRVFRIYKFRSMVVDGHRRTDSKLYENDPGITRAGSFIRKTSIDELPQLLNIIAGDMSFIGPRPPVPHFPKKIGDYNEFEYQRFLVKPGISGLAQVRCREIHDWDINIPIDVEYVHNYSFGYDLKLFLSSLMAFFRTDNIYTRQ
ncbi:MAG: sugar transferase [Bacteroidales bacterium]|nr:sugar transferase [Bacteroidales bacterium]